MPAFFREVSFTRIYPTITPVYTCFGQTFSNGQAMAKMAQTHARTEHQIYQLLTPEQRKQLEERRVRPQQIDMP